MRLISENVSRAPETATPAQAVSVVKFGSSVLRGPADAEAAAAEIARLSARGDKIVAVISAFLGETDRLLAESSALSKGRPSQHAARLVSLGEERACLCLAIACEAMGLRADYLDVETLDLAAAGPDNEATPISANRARLHEAVNAHDVAIIPGFAALKDGRHVLLGRGGSDLSAVFLAALLGQRAATLIKDVDGVYDRDPAVAGAQAQRFEALGYDEAMRVAGKLVQERAIRYAQTEGVAIRVRRLGADDATTISDLPPSSPAQGRLASRALSASS